MTGRIRLDAVYKQIDTCHRCPLGRVEGGRAVCGSDGKEVLYFNDSYRCPQGKWVAETVYMHGISPPRVGGPAIPTLVPNPAVVAENAAKAKKRAWWKSAAESIEAAGSAVMKKVGQGIQAATVITSGRATDEEIATRQASCAACPSRKTNAKGQSFCGACGCGENRWSLLDKKITFAECPCELGKPGFFGSPEPSDPSPKVSFGGAP